MFKNISDIEFNSVLEVNYEENIYTNIFKFSNLAPLKKFLYLSKNLQTHVYCGINCTRKYI